MLHLNVGYNFDRKLPGILAKLNDELSEKTGSVVSEVYGSDRAHSWLAARPDFRLPDISEQALYEHIQMLKQAGIGFNYTMNTPHLGSKNYLEMHRQEFLDWCAVLVQMGVERFIVTNPILLEMLETHLPDLPVKIELSTIMHIDTPMQLVAFKQQFPRVDKVVGNILYNRNFPKLSVFNRVSNMYGITYELMVNEFCMIASGKDGENLGAHCIYRDSCYGCHADNVTKDDALLMKNYPMGKCMSSRAHTAADWLRSFFVRPQDLRWYHDKTGLDTFKVTGRTAKTPYIEEVTRAYMTGVYDQNLLRLWKPLETIYSEKDEVHEHKYRFNLPTEKLDGFIAGFFTRDCSSLLCSECNYCDDWAKAISGEYVPIPYRDESPDEILGFVEGVK